MLRCEWPAGAAAEMLATLTELPLRDDEWRTVQQRLSPHTAVAKGCGTHCSSLHSSGHHDCRAVRAGGDGAPLARAVAAAIEASSANERHSEAHKAGCEVPTSGRGGQPYPRATQLCSAWLDALLGLAAPAPTGRGVHTCLETRLQQSPALARWLLQNLQARAEPGPKSSAKVAPLAEVSLHRAPNLRTRAGRHRRRADTAGSADQELHWPCARGAERLPSPRGATARHCLPFGLCARAPRSPRAAVNAIPAGRGPCPRGGGGGGGPRAARAGRVHSSHGGAVGACKSRCAAPVAAAAQHGRHGLPRRCGAAPGLAGWAYLR
jgi:hypothetical protein